MAKAKRIIADSIKDHLIPHVSSFKTPKEVYDALRKMFKGKNINEKMTLRNQLKNVNVQNFETIQYYFGKGFSNKRTIEQLKKMSKNEKL